MLKALKPSFFAAVFLALIFSHSTFAAEVVKVKGSAILIDTTGDDIRMGDTYYLMSGTKKKGIVKIIKLRPGQALAKLLKGVAVPNWTLQKRSSQKAKRRAVVKKRKPKAPAPKVSSPKSIYSSKRVSRKKKAQPESKLAIGLAMGMNNNSSTVVFLNDSSNAERTDDYAGSSTSFELIADYQMYKKLLIRTSLGMQNFFAGGDTNNSQCGTSGGEVCQVDLGYMNLDFWLRYNAFDYGRFKFWGGAGLGILFSPKFNSTTSLNEDDLATTTLMQIGGGADIKLTDSLYVPFWAEYGLFPSSDTVDMTSFSLYFGLAYRL